ncbi:MAG TPA: universal stress protein [Chitinophagaceae bacterium]|nr:universal stress protein [Chitinophagaceae bacterium]
MYRLFNNILIPVDLRREAAPVVEKAMNIATRFNCDIHLLYIMKKRFWSMNSHLPQRLAEKKLQLHNLREKYSPSIGKGCLLHTQVWEGDLEHSIAEYAAIHHIDLILAQKPASIIPGINSGLNIDRLAAKTNAPVLSLLPHPSFRGIKNIVVPVSGYLPTRRIMLAIYLAKNFNSAIHLISLTGSFSSMESKSHAYLEKAYQLLRENTNLPIRCKTIIGKNIADTALDYAKRIDASLILVNQGLESLLPGPSNPMFAKFLFKKSSIPVITVA